MSSWWTYSLSDVLLFSADTYQRLFERYNEALWPWQLLPLAAGLMLPLAIKAKPEGSGRWTAAFIALAWAWVAWGFHLQRYAVINWAAPAFAAVFLVQGVFLIWTGVLRNRLIFRRRASMPGRVGWGVYYFALIGQPLLSPLLGDAWIQSGLFGTAPDPTATATLGMVLAASNRSHWGLMILPLAWCAVSGATLYGLASPLAAVMFLVPPITLVCALAKALQNRPDSQ